MVVVMVDLMPLMGSVAVKEKAAPQLKRARLFAFKPTY
jgi:hypothetical protein